MRNNQSAAAGEHTLVIGGGLAGAATFYELTRRGMPATLLEAREGAALEASFANGAMLTPSMSNPWNSPGVGKHLLASLFDSKAAMKLHFREIPGLALWGLRFLHNSTSAHYRKATESIFLLADYSVGKTEALVEAEGLDCDFDRSGTLKIFESDASMASSLNIAESLQRHGFKYRVLTSDQLAEFEPKLAEAHGRFVGAIHYPRDRVGDAHKFASALIEKAQTSLDSAVKYNVRVQAIRTEAGSVAGVETDQGFIAAGRVIICMGTGSPQIAKPLGVSLPIKPVKGYSITFSMPAESEPPRHAIVDDAMHAAVVPLGDRMRVVGTAEFAGYDRVLSRPRIDNLIELLRRLYPGIAAKLDTKTVEPWANFRPMSADGLPIIGEAGAKGLWFNTGHGYLGWTLAAGSAAILADLIQSKPPEVNSEPYRVER